MKEPTVMQDVEPRLMDFIHQLVLSLITSVQVSYLF